MYFPIYPAALFLLSTIIWNVVAVERSTTTPTLMTACCTVGSLFVKLNTGPFQPDEYNCIDANSTGSSSTPDYDEILGTITAPFNFLTQMQHEKKLPITRTGIPVCERPVLVDITRGGMDRELSTYSCLANLNNAKLIAISCPSTTMNRRMERVSVVHKCCPNNYVYDESKQMCIRFDPNLNVYSSMINSSHFTVFVDSAVDCPSDRVLIEYHLTADRFQITNSQLILMDTKQQFNTPDYCIEAITSLSNATPNVTNSTKRPIININNNQQRFLVRVCDVTDICDHMLCIRRCCVDGELYRRNICTKDELDIQFHSFEHLDITANLTKPSVFGILRGLDCAKYYLDPDKYNDEMHTINEADGSLRVLSTRKHYTNDQYCIEKMHNASSPDQQLYTFLCFDNAIVGSDGIRFRLYPIGLLISCCFYIITLLVYLTIEKLRNLPGQILICLVCSLFAAYLSIALGQLMPTPNDNVCATSAFFIYFCLMAAFAWMNVMCFDIWQTFGTAKGKKTSRGKERKRFVYYSLYGWGLPILMTAITYGFSKAKWLNEKIRPHFGQGRCWFDYGKLASANLIFFSGPIGIIFLVNFVLFIVTLRYCNKVKREIFRMQSSNMEKPALRSHFFMNKALFAMNTKLFIVMGITWLLELLSIILYDHKKTFFWAISDSFNVLLGVFVFFIFVFKKRIWHLIKERLGMENTNENAKHTTRLTTCASNSTYDLQNIPMQQQRLNNNTHNT